MNYPDGLTRAEWLAVVAKNRNPFYVHPADLEQRIWRYMDFAKFVALIDSSELFFPVASTLDDSFEGSVSEANIRERPKHIAKTIADFAAAGSSAEVDETRAILERHAATWSTHLEWQRQWTYISCWHKNDHESAAMWKLYASSNQAIAVQSAFANLQQCLEPYVSPPQGEPILAEVCYVDYSSDLVRSDVYLSEYFHKRKSFEHEQEIRAVVQELPTIPRAWDSAGNVTASHFDLEKAPSPGKGFPIDLETLICNVYIAPDAPNWLEGLVKRLLFKYDVDKPVTKSALNGLPLY